ncbi:BRI1 kinase inhibitor 1-like [Papaver somniferum]|uniref:BRI1 kinase inhibitor 1-like n=1 Tax=Papaver somniferum TaxID=3469 RepID=UPI000E704339|nr:BRI1 kinase inhibitor 1-like [Papaver somniferum]
MNSNQQKKKNYEGGGGGGGGGEKEMLQSTKKGQQLSTITSSPPSSTTCSPSHEFSFTISLHSSSNEKTITKSKSKTPTATLSPPHNSFAIDLSPADDIFFHGHLLPLHLLSHLPISPRSSTNSLDSFTLPIKELQDDSNKRATTTTTTNTNTTVTTSNTYTMSSNNIYNNAREINGRIKAKSFSFLKFPRRAKGSEFEEREKEMEKKKKKTGGFNMIQIIRRYAKMVRPLLFYKNGSGKTSATTTTRRETAAGAGHFDFEREPYSSFSGNLSLRGTDSNNKKRESRGRRGEFSAPASMWTSPTNSGLLLTTPLGVHSSSSESNMEELQSAIQAAIAHCKNSSTPIKEGDNKLQS